MTGRQRRPGLDLRQRRNENTKFFRNLGGRTAGSVALGCQLILRLNWTDLTIQSAYFGTDCQLILRLVDSFASSSRPDFSV